MSTNQNLESKPASRRRIHPGVFAAMVILVFAGTIGIGAALGDWQVNGRGNGTGAGAGAGNGTGAGAGTGAGTGSGSGSGSGSGRVVSPQSLSTSDIKGWMAIGDVAAAWSIPLPEILATFNLPADTPPSAALKDLESDLFSVSNLRDWLASRTAAGASEGP
jgi:hypothetical protein